MGHFRPSGSWIAKAHVGKGALGRSNRSLRFGSRYRAAGSPRSRGIRGLYWELLSAEPLPWAALAAKRVPRAPTISLATEHNAMEGVRGATDPFNAVLNYGSALLGSRPGSRPRRRGWTSIFGYWTTMSDSGVADSDLRKRSARRSIRGPWPSVGAPSRACVCSSSCGTA